MRVWYQLRVRRRPLYLIFFTYPPIISNLRCIVPVSRLCFVMTGVFLYIVIDLNSTNHLENSVLSVENYFKFMDFEWHISLVQLAEREQKIYIELFGYQWITCIKKHQYFSLCTSAYLIPTFVTWLNSDSVNIMCVELGIAKRWFHTVRCITICETNAGKSWFFIWQRCHDQNIYTSFAYESSIFLHNNTSAPMSGEHFNILLWSPLIARVSYQHSLSMIKWATSTKMWFYHSVKFSLSSQLPASGSFPFGEMVGRF